MTITRNQPIGRLLVSRELLQLLMRDLNGGSDFLTGTEHMRAYRELRALLNAPLCKACLGEGVVHTGIDESPTTHCNRCDGCGVEPAAQSKEEPVKVAFDTLRYGAKYKYEPEHGADKVYVKIGHNLVASWDERLAVSSPVRQGLYSFATEDGSLSDPVYLVADTDLNVVQAQGEVIEQQRLLITSLRKELVESYSIGAHAPTAAPKSECPACLGDSMFGCDACIPDFSPGSGNKDRRRAEALQKGCTQPQAHPARCGCKDGNE